MIQKAARWGFLGRALCWIGAHRWKGLNGWKRCARCGVRRGEA